MRVLMTITPGLGHTYPMVPLAWALQMAGHHVLVASCGPGLAMGEAGVRTVDVAPGLSLSIMQRTLGENHPDLIAKLASDSLDDDYHATIGAAVAAALRLQPGLVDGMIRTAEEWRPDVVVYSPLLTAGLVAAAKLGVPAVRNEFGLVRTDDSPRLMRELNADIFDRHGVDLPDVLATIDITPPSMGPIEPGAWQMGAVPYDGGGALPPRVYELLTTTPRRPRVVVTFGSGPPPSDTALLMEQIVSMAPQTDASFLLVTPTMDLEPYGTLPPNVHALGWAPLGALLAGCAAVVHHGGPGSAFSAIMNGVPQLLPEFGGLGRPLIVDAVTRRGVGTTVPPGGLTRELLESVIADDTMRQAIHEVRAEIRSLPTPVDIAARVVELVTDTAGASRAA